MKFKICIFDEKDRLLYENEVEKRGDDVFHSPVFNGYYVHFHEIYMFVAGELMEAYYE